MAWIYHNKLITTIEEGAIGFIYLIRSLVEDKIYVGKKLFHSTRKTKIGKREIKATKTRKRVRIVKKESDWQNYQSSCLPLQEDIKKLGIHNFEFIIIEFCENKRELSYREVWWQFHFDVLGTGSYNENILGRFFKPKK